jgi:hypothetical protein
VRASLPQRLRRGLLRRGSLAHSLVSLALFAWAFAVFDAARSVVGFHPDESAKIATSRYFGYLFLEGDLDHEAWAGGYFSLTTPPGFRYVLGAGLWLQGHDLGTLNQPYHFSETVEQNRREGRVPTEAVLMDARRVAVLFGAGTVALLYVVGVQLGAPPAGAVAALLAGASPYLREHFARALAESTFSFFLLAALALCLATFRRPAARFGPGTDILAGSALGLAVASKLTAILSLPALMLACAGAALGAHARGERDAWWWPLKWGCVAGLTCWGLFVALYPFLWPDPPARTLALLRFRDAEMRHQQNALPQSAVRDPGDRLELVLGHALVNRTWAQSTLGVPLDVPLAALGLATLGAAACRDWRAARHLGPAALLLLWLLSYVAGTAWGYGLDWARYTVPLFLLAALLSGLGAQWLVARGLENWSLRVAGDGDGTVQPSAAPPSGKRALSDLHQHLAGGRDPADKGETIAR